MSDDSTQRVTGRCPGCGSLKFIGSGFGELCEPCARAEAGRERRRQERQPRSQEEKRKRLESQRLERAAVDAIGLCLCGAPRTTGRKTCEACRAAKDVTTQRRKELRESLGLCCCGKPAAEGRKGCPDCLARAVAQVALWRKKNPEHAAALRRSEWEHASPEKIARLLEWGRKWKSANPERNRAYNRTWQAANRDRTAASSRKHRELYGSRFHKYGINRAEFDAMLAAQSGCCAICRRVLDSRSAKLDHHHAFEMRDPAGHRGILCHGCNSRLGFVEKWNAPPSDAEARYLRKFQRTVRLVGD